MSTNNLHDCNNSLFNKIQPIDDASYANGINAMIEAINNNFAVLANHDFIKGDPADSVKVVKCNYENNESLINTLKSYIEGLLGSSEVHEVNGHKYLDNFDIDNVEIQAIFNINTVDNIETIVSTMPYIFLDGRFWANNINEADVAAYDGVTDKSCVIIGNADNNGNISFSSLNTAFPTMYYDPSIGLCWKWHGKESGMPVSGPAGKDGKNAVLYNVKIDKVNTDSDTNISSGEVTHIFVGYDCYVDVENEYINKNDYVNCSALVIDSTTNNIYSGVIKLNDENKLIVYLDPNIPLNKEISGAGLKKLLKDIKLTQSDPTSLNGLFIPIDDSKENAEQPAHLISASAILNIAADNDAEETMQTDVIFTPVKDINNFTVNEDNLLQVDKYMYIKFDPEAGNKFLDAYEESNTDIKIKNILSNSNYYIKYKLTNIITSKDDLLDFMPKVDNANYGYVKLDSSSDNKDAINDTNIVYATGYDNDSKEYIVTNDVKDTLTTKDLESNPLYVWEYCDHVADYDINEMKLIDLNGGTKYPKTPVALTYICTNTFTPGESTPILWFNVLDVLDKTDDNKFIVRGWSKLDGEANMLSMTKFIPVYNDEKHHVNIDTAINFNYNVNITGCDHENSNSTNNLSVNGDVNCNNIKVYEKASIKEIDNIYTKNPIVGQSGMQLGYNNDKYGFIVDEKGNATINSIESTYIESNTITSDYIEIINDGALTLPNLNVTSNDEVNIEISSNKDVKVDINNLDDVKIKKLKKLNDTDISNHLGEDEYAAKIATNIPIIACDKSSINITDANIDNTNSIFVDENIDEEMYRTFNAYVVNANENEDENEDYYNQLLNDLKESPNSYYLNKEIVKYKIEKEQKRKSNIIKMDIKPEVINYTKDYYDGIYNNNCLKPTTQWQKCFDSDNIENDGELCKFEITKSANIESISSKNISIIPCKMIFNMGLYVHNDNRVWTSLLSSDKNYLRFRVIVKDGDETVCEFLDKNKYTFDNVDTKWRGGYTLKDGNPVASDNYETWRYKTFEINPIPIYFDEGYASTINNRFKDLEVNEDLTVFVYPEFQLNVGGLDKNNEPNSNKNVADDCKICKFVPIGTRGTMSNIIKETTFYTYDIDNGFPQDNNSILRLSISRNNTTDTINNTIICKDGILIHSKNQITGSAKHEVFGFGLNQIYDSSENPKWSTNPEICYGYIDNNELRYDSVPIKDMISFINDYKKSKEELNTNIE